MGRLPDPGRKRTGKKPAKIVKADTFNPKMLKLIESCAFMGWNDAKIARALGIENNLFSKWKSRFPQIVNALQAGRNAVVDVGTKLKQCADGQYYNEQTEVWAPEREEIEYIPDPSDPMKVKAVVKIIPKKLVERKITRKFMPPSVAAIKYALNNRDPEHWREAAHIDHTTNGKDLTAPALDLSKLTDEEVALLAELENKMRS